MWASAVPVGASAKALDPANYAGLRWREIGPLRGGRTTAVAGVPSDEKTYYMAPVNGGIWKTENAGRTWDPIFDDQDTGSIGALAIAPSNEKIIYAGSGEGRQRPDLAIGDGMYASSDAGKTWTHLGLRDAQQIPAIAVDPRDAKRLYVAALGHPYGPNTERGVYRSTDGGATFQRVLYKDENTGAFSISIDPQFPDTVYATLWSARQAPWEIGSSFELPQSGLYKSTDGGTTWSQLSTGLPARFGRASVAVAPSDSSIVYIYADSYADGGDGGALDRSDDAGAHFAKTNDYPGIAERGDDLATVAVDPKDPMTLYVSDTSAYRSTDGGKTMTAFKGAPGGDDYQAIWINSNHPDDIILGVDQGATLSLDRGRTWSSWYNQPTAQMYHVSADDRFPYRVCGGQQESGSACVLSRGDWGQINERDWHTAGAEEYGYVIPDPLHPGVFFGGKVERFDEATGQAQEVSPIVFRSKDRRLVRTEPLAFDPIGKRTLYFGANVVYATTTGGTSWKQVSPDLTRPHPAVPAVIRAFEATDPQHGMHRGVVYSIAPSYTHQGTIWAGTDDGLVWVTRNGGKHWSDVTPAALTPWSKIAQIDASHFDDGTAYVAVNRFRLDDQRAYAYRTHDGGKTWRDIGAGLPLGPVNAIRQDPHRKGLLYAATESGVYVSFDDGNAWQSLQQNLPRTSVRDLVVHGNDLVIATHGRGFWILDDIAPLRDLAAGGASPSIRLFAPELAYRVRRSINTDTPLPPEEPHGQNPPDGAIFDYALAAPASRVSIEILDASGAVLRRYASDDPKRAPIEGLDKPAAWERPQVWPPTSAGEHRFVWDLHLTPPVADSYDLPISAVYRDTPRVPEGPLVAPGLYTVRLTVDGRVSTQHVRVAMDPRSHMSQAQLGGQYAVARQLATYMDRTHAAALAARKGKANAKGDALDSAWAKCAQLLDQIDGVDAPPTLQERQAFALAIAQAKSALLSH
jgi:photosystem II stability/assembly factor-like uncharacterized protein